MTKDSSRASSVPGRGAKQGRISDFSPIAAQYDATRELPTDKLADCYSRLMGAGIIPHHGRVLDAGCGTGQASLPLAALGCEVLGIDVSWEMTSRAQAKVQSGCRADYIVGDVRDIEFEAGHFDAAVVSKLFQHVQDWRQACRELIRVVRPSGCIVQVNERGAFGNAVRQTFSRMADQRGFTRRYSGLNPHSDGDGVLVEFMRSEGCSPVPVDMSDLRWDATISYGEAVRRIRERLSAEFWHLPETVYQELLASTEEWIDTHPHGADTVQTLTPYLNVKVFRTPGPR